MSKSANGFRKIRVFVVEWRMYLDSDVFWQQYQAGQMDDSADYVEWNVVCKMRERLLSRLETLRGKDAGENVKGNSVWL